MWWCMGAGRRQEFSRGPACPLRNDSNDSDCLPACSISDNGQVSVLVVRGTDVVAEACRRHQTSPTASAALGRALLGTLLLGSFRWLWC